MLRQATSEETSFGEADSQTSLSFKISKDLKHSFERLGRTICEYEKIICEA